MAVITITDTGKYVVGGSPIGGEDKAYSGAAIILPGVTISYGLEAGIEDTTETNKKEGNSATSMYDYPVVDHMSVSAPSWTVSGVINADSTTYDPTEVTGGGSAPQHELVGNFGLPLFGILNSLTRTKGIKEVTGDLPNYSNEGVANTTINCRVKGLVANHESINNIINWTLTLVETR